MGGFAFSISLYPPAPASSATATTNGGTTDGGIGMAPTTTSTVVVAHQADAEGIIVHPGYDFQNPTASRANMDYVAPECLLDHKAQVKSDMYSFGCFIYAIFHPGGSPLMRTRDSFQAYKVV